MLFKNVYRTLMRQKFQLLLLGLIIILSSFIYTTMDYGIGGILTPTINYFEDSNQEDFAISMTEYLLPNDYDFIQNHCNISDGYSLSLYDLQGLKNTDQSCYYSVLDYRLNLIEAKYDDISLEVREYKDLYYELNDDSHKLRLLKDMDEINKSYLVDGSLPTLNNQIAITEIYANLNNLEIGDTITIGEKDYEISGYVLFPDYSLAIFGSELLFDNKSQTIALMTDDEFENLNEKINFDIAGVYTDITQEEFESTVIDTYREYNQLNFITSIIKTENNMRSGAIYGEIEGGQAMGLGLSLVIASIALLIVSIMVSKVLESQRGPIGILKSMGYKNSEITLPYIFFISIFAFPAIIIGYFIGVLAAEPLKNMYLLFYLLPSKAIEQTPQTFFIAVLVPFLFLLVISYFIIKRMLNKKPVDLLNPQVTDTTNKLTKSVGKIFKNFKITEKLKHLLLYRNLVKFSVFMIGMFYAGFLILFSFSMMGMFDRMINDYYENTDYEYVGYCDYENACPLIIGNQEKVIELPGVILADEEIYLVGLEEDSNLHKLYNQKNNEITYRLEEDGIIITKSLSISKGFKIGDVLTLEIGDTSIDLEVLDISGDYNGDKAYINIELLSNTITQSLPEATNDYYNVVYSDTELNEDDFAIVVSTQDILDQTQDMQKLMNYTVSILIFVSIIIGAIIVYILTVMTIEDNFYNISLFKVIGYNKKEINKMILGGYLQYGILIFIFIYPITILTTKYMEIFFAKYYNVIMPMKVTIWHGLLSLVMFIVIFYIGAIVARRKLDIISLQEAMKMYQI